MIIDCIADLHGDYPKLEGGDLLIVAGDLTARHSFGEFAFDFITWISKQDYKKKIVVAGNHDTMLGEGTEKLLEPFAEYLCDSGTEITYYPYLAPPDPDKIGITYKRTTLKVWASPWTKTFPNMNPHCKAFTVDTEEELEAKWAIIPEDIDILITHSPPYGILDKNSKQEHCGSETLFKELYRIKPKLHVFGHIHESYGILGNLPEHYSINQFVNASHVNERYQPVNKPVRITL